MSNYFRKKIQTPTYVLAAVITITIGGWSGFVYCYQKYNELASLKKLKKAEDCIAEGRINDAEDFIKDVLKKEPDNVPFRALSANINTMKGDYEGAVADLNRVLKEQPKNVFALLSMGAAYEEIGMLEEAEKYYNEYKSYDPNNITLLKRLSLNLLVRGKTKKAIEILEKSALQEIKKKDANIWFFLASAYLQAREYDKALEEAKNAISVDPHALLCKADALFCLGRFNEAGECYKEMYRQNSKNIVAMLKWVMCGLAKAPDDSQNIKEYQEILKDKSQSIYPYDIFLNALLYVFQMSQSKSGIKQ